ncbi:hypothetical protein I5U65_00585 [Stenotrophomonas maltophilia]|uniref:hypothetical protein n=1 Tax=Stenotrophomonas sp. GD03680 TaxID=2975365 RepID=UPI0018D3F931|nr:hypothetical protein [Stenotrophomonas sp. GD03680]MBH1633680.1 hypothetical protein [Stenotrophomonas maltophilia]MDH2022256.1 hypothetical protein [Stenotrophomonas sp. GD03680]
MDKDNRGPLPPPARNPAPPLPPGLTAKGEYSQVVTGDDYDRLWRIAYAVELLAALPAEAAKVLGITADHTHAVAEYISEDLRGILSRSKPADE